MLSFQGKRGSQLCACGLAFSLFVLRALLASAAHAQTPPAEAVPGDVTADDIEALLNKVKSGGLDEATTTQITAFCTQAKQELTLAAEAAAAAKQFEANRIAAPTALEDLKCLLVSPAPDATAGISTNTQLSELEQLKNAAEVELVRAQTVRSALPSLQSRAARRTEVAGLAATAAKELEELQAQLAVASPAGQAAEFAAANRMLLTAKRRRIQQQMAAYEQELLSYDAVGNELLKLELDRAKRDEEAAQRRIAALATAINEQRRVITEREAGEARLAAASAHPAVRRLAKENQKLAELRSELAFKMQAVAADLNLARTTLKSVNEKYERVQQQVDTAGFTNAIGQLLRKHRTELPDVRHLQQACEARHEETANVQFLEFDLKDRERALEDLDARVAEVVAGIGSEEHGVSETIRMEVRRLLVKELEILASLVGEIREYDTKLIELDGAERALISRTREYATFIDQRVLWIRSASYLSPASFHDSWEGILWLTDADQWSALANGLLRDARNESFLTGLVLLLLVVSVALRRKLKRWLKESGEMAEKSHRTEFLTTIHALVATLLLAVPVPAMVWYVSWRLQSPLFANDFAVAIATGLSVAVRYLLATEVFRHVCAVKGLAESHFNWSPSALRLLRRHLRWISVAGPLLAGVVAVYEWQAVESWINSIGRSAFILGQVLLALYMQRVLRPAGGALHLTIATNRNSLLDRCSPVWYTLFVGSPLAFALLAGAGFYYTALRLSNCFQTSICWSTALLLVHAVLRRWLMLARRKLAMQQARQRRAAAQAEAKESGQAIAADGEGIAIEEHRLDLSDIDTQTRRLLQSFTALAFVVGCGLIWSSVLPALGLFSGMTVWGDGVEEEAVTLQKVIMSLIVVVMTVIAGRNIPGLLEISILQRLPIEPAVRYATTTVCKYIIIAAGTLTACRFVGIQWGEVQWLVAAMSVGLGFGLQEIFANFISGLIILFERPIRVGDIVTISGVSGIVSRIRMRATTITDWDRKELIVPNKEFITGQLVNWSLTDSTLRITFRIGVEFQSDTDLTRQLLLQVASNHPNILRDPAPSALFIGFGESTLNFELRVFVAGLEHFLTVQHDTNTAIYRTLSEAGIQIARPKRDIRIHTIDPTELSSEAQILKEAEEAGRTTRLREAG